MAGWLDDWMGGKVDAWTAFNGWLDASKSPSERANEHCGYSKAKESCRLEHTNKFAEEDREKYGW